MIAVRLNLRSEQYSLKGNFCIKMGKEQTWIFFFTAMDATNDFVRQTTVHEIKQGVRKTCARMNKVTISANYYFCAVWCTLQTYLDRRAPRKWKGWRPFTTKASPGDLIIYQQNQVCGWIVNLCRVHSTPPPPLCRVLSRFGLISTLGFKRNDSPLAF